MRVLVKLENIFGHPAILKGDLEDYVEGKFGSILMEPNDIVQIEANIPKGLKIKSTPYFSNEKIKYISLDVVDEDF